MHGGLDTISSTTRRSGDLLGLDPRILCLHLRSGGAPPPRQVAFDATKVLQRGVLCLLILGALLDAFYHERHLFFVAQIRTRSALAKMCKVAERTQLVAGELERAIAHLMDLAAHGTFSDDTLA